ncbi:MAG: YidC/Oxa1 family membrane protein insertase [bacterium]|nr:YidC/Oxa1 family membrane protein insertase [bacterium]
MIAQIFQVLFYQPFFNALVFIYNIIPGHDLGIAVIALTLLVRVLTFPLNSQAIKAQRAMARIQPKLKEIQVKYKDNSQEQMKATSALFKEEKITPFSGFVPILIQLPILIALYQIFWKGLWTMDGYFYSFVSKPEVLNPFFLGIVDLSKPSALFAILAGLGQLWQSLTATSAQSGAQGGKVANMMTKQMTFLFPVLTVFILLKLPAALGLYWLATSLLTIAQQYFSSKPRTAL